MFKLVNIALIYYYISAIAFIIYPYIFIRALKKTHSSLSYGVYDHLRLSFPIIVIFNILLFKYSISFSLYLVLFYFGGYFFYIFFRQTRINLDFKLILILISILTIVEAVAINTVILPSDLPNWPLTPEMTEIYGSTSRGSVILNGFNYLRPMGFGGNSSITASLIMAMFIYIDKCNKSSLIIKTLVFASVISLYSGIGFILLIFYLSFLSRYKLVFIPILIYFGLTEFKRYQKLDLEYYQHILTDIMKNFTDVIGNYELHEIIFGQDISVELPIGGDFFWLYFFQWFGIVGVLFYVVLILIKSHNRNIFPLLVLLISTLHYHTIFSIPGQMIFGYLLSRRKLNYKAIKIRNSYK